MHYLQSTDFLKTENGNSNEQKTNVLFRIKFKDCEGTILAKQSTNSTQKS